MVQILQTHGLLWWFSDY